MAYINKINVAGMEYEVQDKNALPAAELPEAINTALTQAKESGEFDGESGVYVGTDTPPDGTKVWINPNGVATFPMPTANDAGKVLKAKGANEAEWGEASGGVSSWNDLTDKPFGEEAKVVTEPLILTWDGNTEGLTVVNKVNDAEDGEVFNMGKYKVSDIVLTDEQLRSASYVVYVNYGEGFQKDDEVSIADRWNDYANQITDECAKIDKIMVVKKPSEEYPECGIYFAKDEVSAEDGSWTETLFVQSLITTEPVEHTKTTITTLDPKYLPQGVGGGAFVVNFTFLDDTNLSADKTLDEIAEAYASGLEIKAVTGVTEGSASERRYYPLAYAIVAPEEQYYRFDFSQADAYESHMSVGTIRYDSERCVFTQVNIPVS